VTVAFSDVLAAAARLRGVGRLTPVLSAAPIDRSASAQVFLKAENQQRTGSFKFRGAFNAVAAMADGNRDTDLCTVSSGNHGQALAAVGAMLRRSVTVYVPRDAPRPKYEAIVSYGATVKVFDRQTVAQEEISSRLGRPGGPVYVSSHDDRQVIAGAGTMALELFDSCDRLDAIVVPVGGGGGLAGAGVVARAVAPRCRVIGVEPEASGAVSRSIRAGRRIHVPVPRTIADGQTVTVPGRLNLRILRRVVDEVVAVNEAQIRQAVAFLYARCGVIVEPSGACGVAAVLAGRVAGRRIGVVLTGGNVDSLTLRGLLDQSANRPSVR